MALIPPAEGYVRQPQVDAAVSAHTLLQNVHGLNITVGKTLTVQDDVTIIGALGSAAYAATTAFDTAGLAAAVQSNLNSHTGNTSNPHSVTASQVGLGNVTNNAQVILQSSTPGAQQTGHINVSGSIISGALAALTTSAESWIGPSSTAGIYFKGGNVGIGTTNPQGTFHISDGTALSSAWNLGAWNKLIISNNSNYTNLSMDVAGIEDYRPVYMGLKSRGTTASPSAVQNNDQTLSFLASGYDGSAFQNSAAVDFYVDGSVSVGSVPQRISFVTGTTSINRTERMTIKNDGKVGIGTTSPTNLLSLGGNAARTIWMERHTTANTQGNSLTVQAGGATAAATDKAGGQLILKPGVATGTGEAGVTLQGCVAGGSGTGDNSFQDMVKVLGNKLGFFNATPVLQQLKADHNNWATTADVVAALVNLGLFDLN